MDRYELKLKLDQIDELTRAGNHEDAAEIADQINWKKIKNVNTLTKIGDMYAKAKRFDEATDILLMAYDKSPIGRTIVARLAEVAIEAGRLDEASEYIDEFLHIAPNDAQRYVLKYKLAKAGGVSLPKQIELLEKLKEIDYSEEWAYELAYLYYKVGRKDECVDLCDEIVLWFGDGDYVEKALELKMLYTQLNKHQEDKYRQIKLKKNGYTSISPSEKLHSGEMLENTVQIPTIISNTGRFNTINLQAEIAKSMETILNATEKETVQVTMDSVKKMVEDVPYLKLSREEEEDRNRKLADIATDEEIDGSLNINFRELLEEDTDGQMMLNIPDQQPVERQITGQMSIDDILAEWEKTRRAAETAMEIAEKQKLEAARERALLETGDIMERIKEERAREEKEAAAESERPDPTVELPDLDALVIREAMKEKEKQEKEMGVLSEALSILKTSVLDGRRVAKPALDEIRLRNISDEEEPDRFTGDAEDASTAGEPQAEPAVVIVSDDAKEEAEEAPAEPLPQEMPQVSEPEYEYDEFEQTELTEEQKKIFSYFVPVNGMERQICNVISSAARHIAEADKTSKSGNIIIQGYPGSGKTRMAANILQALKEKLGRNFGTPGRIYADSLNTKDLSQIIDKVRGGCLIIEKAGDLNKETAIKLSLLMEQNTDGLLIIMEDTRVGIEQALGLDLSFSKKFTEKLNIPIFTNDELVAFAKVYADEADCELDEMAVLALYNRISNIQRVDSATTLAEVKDIMDEAIENAEQGSLKRSFSSMFSRKKNKQQGSKILIMEEDFE